MKELDPDLNYLGQTNFRNIQKEFAIKRDDRRKHIYIIGKTGMGKTTLMANMVAQDIRNGFGLAFIDPHGEQAEELLDYIPKERIDDVVYLNPSDIKWPIGFNIMEVKDPNARHLIASGLMGVFKKIWPDVWSARMEYILSNSILALLEYPGSTLLGINRMLADVDYRRKVVDKVTDPVIKAFWTQEFARYTQRYEVEATAAIQNKVGQFISNPLIRNIIGQIHSAVDMRELMDEGKILIVNLSKGKIGEASSMLLGALVITKLYLAAMSRVEIPEEKRKDFYLYVDEFQNFATESFANILSEARKYRLSLVVAHQYIAQMEEVVGDAVFGNAGTIISFRVGAEDSEYLEKEFAPVFMAQDFVNLPKFNVYIKLMIDGVAGRPFSAETLKPFLKLEKSFKEEIIESSRKKYSAAQQIVEKQIAEWAKVDTFFAGRQSQKRDNFRKRVGNSGSATPPRPTPAPSPTISLQEALQKEPIPFAFPRKKKDEPKNKNRKEVKLDDLKTALNKALDNKSKSAGCVQKKEEIFDEEKEKKSGILKPGQKVSFD